MASTQTRQTTRTDVDAFLRGIARGFAGALLFSIPMLMTMEMWFLGFYMSRERLLLLLILNMPLLLVLSHRIGFEHTATWTQSARDAIVAYGMGIIASAAILVLLGVVTIDMPPDQWIGMVAVQAVPASIGAMLGRSQLSMSDDDDEDGDNEDEREEKPGTSYATELFMMAVGALFLSLNLAPTEEMILLAYKMTPWHALALAVISILLMHGFVYALAFRGSHSLQQDEPRWHAFIRFTLPGYVVALAVSLYALWTFERLDGMAAIEALLVVIVLAFPAAVGAAAARLIL
ncbi:TIGR02587 family membrane protein [Rhizobium glycinendophyticum]|uniref:TIGR02587 family membrane protein n=1 Tax=Rhizobium glycinendophyticum TaxID=2589807 RepID=A0A504U8F3_9HYPH|nr:TIGR02587 family membrane protein [Rhizobium glycinendophyticum]TPP11448.1 TIGR02587 family membrane protein [Rhizobium glycinendophyticum]